MSSKKSGAQSSTDLEGIPQDSSEQEQEQESPSEALANALAPPAASGSGTIKVTG